jgi:hypothetical protein
MNYVEIELAGKTRKLRFDINGIADVEERAGMGLPKLFSESMAGFHLLRLLLWGGLKWQDQGLTVARAGSMMQTYFEQGGSREELMDKIQKALMLSGCFKVPDEGTDEGNGETEAAN